jgi:hypothetical protein
MWATGGMLKASPNHESPIVPRPIEQSRITLRKLKVNEAKSSKTLCYSADVHFDDQFIARATNDGRGGDARVVACKGAESAYAEAQTYVRHLPALEYDLEDSGKEVLSVTVTFEFLVGYIACEMNVDRLVRESFDRSMKSRLLLIKNAQILYPTADVRGRDLDQMTEVQRRMLFAQVRSKYGSDTIVLAELAREEAYALYKKYIRRE